VNLGRQSPRTVTVFDLAEIEIRRNGAAKSGSERGQRVYLGMAKNDAARARARSLLSVLTGTRRTRLALRMSPLAVTVPSRAIDTRNGAMVPPVRPYAKDA
jgi:hypothetical protein